MNYCSVVITVLIIIVLIIIVLTICNCGTKSKFSQCSTSTCPVPSAPGSPGPWNQATNILTRMQSAAQILPGITVCAQTGLTLLWINIFMQLWPNDRNENPGCATGSALAKEREQRWDPLVQVGNYDTPDPAFVKICVDILFDNNGALDEDYFKTESAMSSIGPNWSQWAWSKTTRSKSNNYTCGPCTSLYDYLCTDPQGQTLCNVPQLRMIALIYYYKDQGKDLPSNLAAINNWYINGPPIVNAQMLIHILATWCAWPHCFSAGCDFLQEKRKRFFITLEILQRCIMVWYKEKIEQYTSNPEDPNHGRYVVSLIGIPPHVFCAVVRVLAKICRFTIAVSQFNSSAIGNTGYVFDKSSEDVSGYTEDPDIRPFYEVQQAIKSADTIEDANNILCEDEGCIEAGWPGGPAEGSTAGRWRCKDRSNCPGPWLAYCSFIVGDIDARNISTALCDANKMYMEKNEAGAVVPPTETMATIQARFILDIAQVTTPYHILNSKSYIQNNKKEGTPDIWNLFNALPIGDLRKQDLSTNAFNAIPAAFQKNAFTGIPPIITIPPDGLKIDNRYGRLWKLPISPFGYDNPLLVTPNSQMEGWGCKQWYPSGGCKSGQDEVKGRQLINWCRTSPAWKSNKTNYTNTAPLQGFATGTFGRFPSSPAPSPGSLDDFPKCEPPASGLELSYINANKRPSCPYGTPAEGGSLDFGWDDDGKKTQYTGRNDVCVKYQDKSGPWMDWPSGWNCDGNYCMAQKCEGGWTGQTGYCGNDKLKCAAPFTDKDFPNNIAVLSGQEPGPGRNMNYFCATGTAGFPNDTTKAQCVVSPEYPEYELFCSQQTTQSACYAKPYGFKDSKCLWVNDIPFSDKPGTWSNVDSKYAGLLGPNANNQTFHRYTQYVPPINPNKLAFPNRSDIFQDTDSPIGIVLGGYAAGVELVGDWFAPDRDIAATGGSSGTGAEEYVHVGGKGTGIGARVWYSMQAGGHKERPACCVISDSWASRTAAAAGEPGAERWSKQCYSTDPNPLSLAHGCPPRWLKMPPYTLPHPAGPDIKIRGSRQYETLTHCMTRCDTGWQCDFNFSSMIEFEAMMHNHGGGTGWRRLEHMPDLRPTPNCKPTGLIAPTRMPVGRQKNVFPNEASCVQNCYDPDSSGSETQAPYWWPQQAQNYLNRRLFQKFMEETITKFREFKLASSYITPRFIPKPPPFPRPDGPDGNGPPDPADDCGYPHGWNPPPPGSSCNARQFCNYCASGKEPSSCSEEEKECYGKFLDQMLNVNLIDIQLGMQNLPSYLFSGTEEEDNTDTTNFSTVSLALMLTTMIPTLTTPPESDAELGNSEKSNPNMASFYGAVAGSENKLMTKDEKIKIETCIAKDIDTSVQNNSSLNELCGLQLTQEACNDKNCYWNSLTEEAGLTFPGSPARCTAKTMAGAYQGTEFTCSNNSKTEATEVLSRRSRHFVAKEEL